jgi:hypothetical protein
VTDDRRDPDGRMSALTDAAAALARGTDLDATVDAILAVLADALGARSAAVWRKSSSMA